MNKLIIIGLPRTGTTSISAALLEHFKVAHTCYSKRAFELADVISDCPCFSDYPQLDLLFPGSKFIYLQRDLAQWVPSIQMLLKKMLPSLKSNAYINPILKRSFEQTFDLNFVKDPLDSDHLTRCYLSHEQHINAFFNGRNNLLSLDVSAKDGLSQLLDFIGIKHAGKEQLPHLNVGKRVDGWKDIKHINKINPNAAGKEGRKFFDY